MIKKHKMPVIKSIWSFLLSRTVSLKKFHNDNEFLVRLWELMRNSLSNNPPQKEILNYITSRNMRRTLVPSDFMNALATQQNMKFSTNKQTVGLVTLNFKEAKKYLMYPLAFKILKFHSRTMLLGNLVSQQFSKKETQEELESSFGGPEIYKLITFIKNFDETIEKHSDILVFFSAYWCHHCLRFRKQFGHAALMAKEANLPVIFATFDVTTDPDVAIEKGVVGIPLIRYYKKGKLLATYKGKRTAEALFEYVKNPPEPTTPEPTKFDI